MEPLFYVPLHSTEQRQPDPRVRTARFAFVGDYPPNIAFASAGPDLCLVEIFEPYTLNSSSRAIPIENRARLRLSSRAVARSEVARVIDEIEESIDAPQSDRANLLQERRVCALLIHVITPDQVNFRDSLEIPMEKDLFERLIRVFEFGSDYLHSFMQTSFRFKLSSTEETSRFVSKHLFWENGVVHLGLSFNKKSYTTKGFFWCCVPEQLSTLLAYLAFACRESHMWDPFIIPISLLDITTHHMGLTVGGVGNTVMLVERIASKEVQSPAAKRIIQSALPLIPKEAWGHEILTQNVHFSASRTVSLMAVAKFQLSYLKQIRDRIDHEHSDRKCRREMFSSREREAFDKVMNSTTNKLEMLESENEDILEDLKGYNTRLMLLVNVIHSMVAQQDSKVNISVARDSKRIAEASKRDSSSMKTIALMTVLFLPGTFIATLFSVDLFKWDAQKSSEVVSGRFWVYWAVTIPLTIMVLLAWLMWVWQRARVYKNQAVEDEEMKASLDVELKGSGLEQILSAQTQRLPEVVLPSNQALPSDQARQTASLNDRPTQPAGISTNLGTLSLGNLSKRGTFPGYVYPNARLQGQQASIARSMTAPISG